MVEGYPVLEGSWYKGAAIPSVSNITNLLTASWAKVGLKVYIFHRNSSYTYVYNILEDRWTTATRMPTPRSGMSCVAVDEKIYCIGGVDKNSSITPKVEIYDVHTNSWVTGSDMPYARSACATIEANGCIYCVGGRASESVVAYLDTTLIYDITTDKWAVGDTSPQIQNVHGAKAILDNKVYGLGSSIYQSNYLSIMDLETKQWSQGTAMPTARSYIAAQSSNGKVYSIGGHNENRDYFFDAIEAYDVNNDRWDRCAPKPTGASTMAVLSQKGKLYCIGGENAYSCLEVYNTFTNSWQVAADIPTLKNSWSACFIEGDKLYCIGSGANMDVDIFQMDDEEPDPGPNPGTNGKKGCFKVEVKITTCGSNTELLQDLNDVIHRHGEELDCDCCCSCK